MQSFSTVVRLLQQLIQIDSQNGNELAVAQLVVQTLKKAGIQCKIDEFEPGRANLIAEVGHGRRILGLSGHLDTVTIGSRDSWKYDPFGGEIINDRLYGRGAADMKSGLAAMITTLIDVQNGDVPINGKVRLLLTAGEEFGAPGSARFAAQGEIDDLNGIVIGEQTDNQVLFAHAGSLNYQLSSIGKAAHSSKPEFGINALTPLFEYANIEKCAFDKLPIDPVLGKVTHSITVINGGEQVNTIPDRAFLRGNIRPTQVADNDQIIETLRQTIVRLPSSGQLKLDILHSFWPVETPRNHRLVKIALKASKNSCARYCPARKVKLGVMAGATDASVFVHRCPNLPVVILGPGENKTAHTANEYTTLSSLQAVNAAYHELVQEFLK